MFWTYREPLTHEENQNFKLLLSTYAFADNAATQRMLCTDLRELHTFC